MSTEYAAEVSKYLSAFPYHLKLPALTDVTIFVDITRSDYHQGDVSVEMLKGMKELIRNHTIYMYFGYLPKGHPQLGTQTNREELERTATAILRRDGTVLLDGNQLKKARFFTAAGFTLFRKPESKL